ncbi:MAG: asparagine synthetase B [Bacteroidia bacterium]
MKRIVIILLALMSLSLSARATHILVPMDETQKQHLKAYGIAYYVLEYQVTVDWLLNYKGGSFMFPASQQFVDQLNTQGVTFRTISDGEAVGIKRSVQAESVNMDAVQLETPPKVAVYTPKDEVTGEPLNQQWDDAVTMVLTYANIPYDIVYDDDVINGKLSEYDWLHLHHEDFTGQYGKFYAAYRNHAWYKESVARQEATARRLGFSKVSQMKLAVAKGIKEFCGNGGFLFAMCSATDSYDIALAAEGLDICEQMYDGDPADPLAQSKLDYSKSLAFTDFELIKNPMQYEFSDIDSYMGRRVQEPADMFTLFEFSAKSDPVPTMLCQNHTRIVKGFMGQTTAFRRRLLKPEVLVMGELKSANEVRYIHGIHGRGMWTFYGGHDPEDYRHLVGEDPTDLLLHPNSPGYRLILNNILFPAARKKKQKT